jgi:CubicO group peptidase (beta-lactamase class C family)
MLLVMRSRAVRVLAAVSVLTVLSAGSVAVYRSRATPAGLDPAAVCRSVGETLAAWEKVGFSGAFALSAEDHGCSAGYGLADPRNGVRTTGDTVFSVGSVTKAMTAAAVLDLAERGRLTLDDRVGRHLAALHPPVADLTLRQLLLHTSGLTGNHGNDHEPLSRRAALTAIDRLPIRGTPGSAYNYSNAGYTLLAAVIEAVSGAPYRDHLVRRILRLPTGRAIGGFWDGVPAAPGPRAVGVLAPGSYGVDGSFAGPHWALEGNGGVAMRVPDLAEWSRALFTGALLTAAVPTRLTELTFADGDRREVPGWGLLEDPSGRPVYAAAGDGSPGHNVAVVWVPAAALSIVVASNGPDVRAEQLLQEILPAVLTGRAPPRPAGPVDRRALERDAGTYVLPGGDRYVADVAVDGLEVTALGATAMAALFPAADSADQQRRTEHAERVEDLLSGRSEEGRRELRALEQDLGGPVAGREVTGTVPLDGELRTYLRLRVRGKSVPVWYAVDDTGAVSAAELDAAPPGRRIVADGAGGYRPRLAAGADLTVRFTGDTLQTISSQGRTEARAAD